MSRSTSTSTSAPPSDLFRPVADGVHVLDPRIGADSMAVIGAMMSRTADLGAKFAQVATDATVPVESLMDQTIAAAAQGLNGASPIRLHPDALRDLLREFLRLQEHHAWDFRNPPAKVRAFLEQNVAGYGHASIASMAKAAFLYLHGFGWPSAWLLEDTPLFDGQEVSTRAVDAFRIPGVNGPGTICRYAPAELQPLHDRWLAVYGDMQARAGTGGWKYDDARVYLPGSIPTGVVWTNDVRTIARHLDHIAALGGVFADLAAQGYAGLDATAPVTTAAIGHRPRRPLGQWVVRRWRIIPELLARMEDDPAAGVLVTAWDPIAPETLEELRDQIAPRPRASTHLDPLWRHAPRIHFSVFCSLAVARDWHRHRPSMPWQLRVVTDRAGQLVMAPWYHMKERLPATLLRDTTAAFYALGGFDPGPTPGPTATATAVPTPTPTPTPGRGIPSARQWEAMHALPFGTLVQLSAVCTLPELVYMLELRATTPGANPEYRAQARAGLQQLCDLLPAWLVEQEHLDGALAQRDLTHPV